MDPLLLHLWPCFDHFGPLKVYLRPQFIVLMQTFRLTIACNNSIPKHLLTIPKQLLTLTKTYLQLENFLTYNWNVIVHHWLMLLTLNPCTT